MQTCVIVFHRYLESCIFAACSDQTIFLKEYDKIPRLANAASPGGFQAKEKNTNRMESLQRIQFWCEFLGC